MMSKKKIKLLYDASIVCNIALDNNKRSGIFFVGYNVLLELLKRPEFDVSFYCTRHKKRLEQLIKNYPEFASCKIYYANFWERMFGYKDIDAFLSPMRAVPRDIRGKKHIKKHVILHDIIPLVVDGYKAEQSGWFGKLIKSVNKNDYYFANSEHTKQDFIKHVPATDPGKITVIPLAAGGNYRRTEDGDIINKVKARYNIPQNKKYIFSLCNSDPRKNLQFAVRNFIEFTKKHNIDNLVFVLGGGGKFNRVLPEFLDNGRVILAGYVDDNDVAALYSGSEMFLFPSLYEGFGMPVLEAMHCGCPVICSDTTSLPEVTGDCGILVDPQSDEQMLAAMEKMYFDVHFRQACIQKGLERAKLFTWEKCVDVIAEKIKENID